MKRWLVRILAAAVLVVPCGCVVSKHPHGAPPGQVKKAMYRCGTCSVVREGPGTCHGAALILVP